MLILFAFAVAATGSFPAHAQSGGKRIPVEEAYETEGGGLLDSVREYVFLSAGAFVTPTGQNKRHLLLASGGFDYSRDNLQIYLEGRVWKQEVSFEQKKIRGSGKRDREVDTDEVELSEGYVSFSPFPQLNVKAGRRNVVWGQFDIFSPVYFTLPFRTQNIGTNFSKVNFGLPQNNVQVSFYPHERVEIQGYFFWKTIVDPLLADFVRQEHSIKRKDLQDHNQYAGRIIVYPNWGTVAVTYFNGRNSLFINLRERVAEDAQSMKSIDENPGLSELQAYSIEASIPRGKWNFKTEFVYRESEGDLEGADTNLTFDSRQDDYLTWALDMNGGKLYGDTRTMFGGVGVEYMTEKWKAEVAGYLFYEEFTGEAETGADLVNAYRDDPEIGLQGVPFFNGAYFITEDKKNLIGLTAGFLGSFAAGASLYAVGTFDRFDYLGAGTLQVVAGLDFLQYFSDSQLSELIDEDGEYEIDDDFTIAPRIGVIWKF